MFLHPPLSLLILAVEVVQEALDGIAEDKACSVSFSLLEPFYSYL